MNDIAIRLSLQVPGAGMLSSQECEQNPKENYDVHKVPVTFTKGKGKFQKVVKQTLVVKTRKQKLVKQNINISNDALMFMLENPVSAKFSTEDWKRADSTWRVKQHLDLIAEDLNAVSYTFDLLRKV